MLDKLIIYFETHLTAKALVFNYMRVWYIFFWASLVLALLTFIPAAFSGVIVYCFLGFAIFIWTAIGFNNKAKKVIRSKYGIKLTSKVWSGLEYHNYIESQLKSYLFINGIKSERLLVKIIEQLSKRADAKKKITYYFLPGFFFAFSVPTWTQFLGKLFTHVDEGHGNILNLLVSLMMGILIVTIILAVIKYTTDDLLTSRSQKLSMLLDYLESIQLELLYLDEVTEKGSRHAIQV